jgi:hypothetical protein
MRRTTVLGGLVLVGLSLTGACVAGGDNPDEPVVGSGVPRADDRASSTKEDATDVVDVAPDSKVGLSLQGSLGPIVEGETITKAMVTLQDVQLVGDGGTSAVLVSDSVTTDLVSIDNDLQKLIDGVSVDPGRYTGVRFRLTSAWMQATDAQGATHVFASDGVDTSQFTSASVSRLQLGGIDGDGFVTVALPQGGIQVQGTSTLALHFALAESLSVQSSDLWVLDPRVWIVDASTFSSVDLQFQATSESFSQFISQGFQVMLFDASMLPVCSASLVVVSSKVFTASFRFVQFFQGPFVAVLVPPSGISLTTQVAVSIDVQKSVHVETDVGLSSVRQVSSGTLEVRTGETAISIQRDSSGKIVRQEERPVGWMQDVASHTPPNEPIRPGEHAPAIARPPQLPGLPPSRNERPAEAGAPPSQQDAGGPPPRHDAGTPPVQRDAGPRPAFEAGAPPTQLDSSAPPPIPDAGAPTVGGGPVVPHADAGGQAGLPPAGGQPTGGQPPQGLPPAHAGGAPTGGRDAGDRARH